MLRQATKRGNGVSVLKGFQDLAVQSPEQSGLHLELTTL